MDDLGRRIRVGILLHLDEASLGVVRPATRGIAVVVGHAASPGGGIAFEGVSALRIEAGERGRYLAHARNAAEVVVDGVGYFARTGSALPRVLGEAHAAQVVVLVADRPVGIGVMPGSHAPQGVVGIARGAAARHGGRGESVQGVVGEGCFVVAGSSVRARRVGYGIMQATEGVVDAGGCHALLIVYGLVRPAPVRTRRPSARSGCPRHYWRCVRAE